MLPDTSRLQEVSDLAITDLADHLYERLFLKLNTELRSELMKAIRVARDMGVEFPLQDPLRMGRWFSSVLSRLISSYDTRSFTPVQLPIEIKVVFDFFLQHMERLIPSRITGPSFIAEPDTKTSHQIYANSEIDELFLEMIRLRSGALVQVVDCNEKTVRERAIPTEPPAGGFMSWIVIIPREQTRSIHIIYNKETLRDINRDAVSTNHLMAKVFLHEFGHVRLHLASLLQNCRDDRTLTPCAKPSEEVEALLYAHTIFGLIQGLKAQLERILGTPDTSYHG